jgi:glutamyl-tRNA synthetase
VGRGYFYIGHAKAAFLNDYFAHDAFRGKFIVCFDDTNPSKEKQEFDDSILHDLALLGIKADQVSYTSDYFQQLYDICSQMIRDGNAYADDTDPNSHKEDRRNRPPDESIAIFKAMKQGTELGRKHCIRARILFDSANGAMRDPVIYRFPNFHDKQPLSHPSDGLYEGGPLRCKPGGWEGG